MYNKVPGMGDFALLHAEFVITVKFTICNNIKGNKNHFALSINSLQAFKACFYIIYLMSKYYKIINTIYL